MSEAPARRTRRAARVLLIDGEGRTLLFRFTPPWGEPFWLPPGGECDPHEDFPQAAARELREETGLEGDPVRIGVVMEYDFTTTDGEQVRALEHYFHHRTSVTVIDTSGHTDLEKDVMQHHRWFAPHELEDWAEPIYPANLASLLMPLLTRAD